MNATICRYQSKAEAISNNHPKRSQLELDKQTQTYKKASAPFDMPALELFS
jgi:hypothetical protein